MNEEIFTDELLRNFLLGKLNEADQDRIEDSFLVDEQLKERVLIVEQELIDDYLEESLTEMDKDLFLLRYGQTAQQKQQLQIAEAFKHYAVGQGAFSPTNPLPAQSRFSQWLRPTFLVPVLATLAIVVVVASIWLATRGQHESGLELELARLNTAASLNDVPFQTLDLKPGVVRGEGGQVDIVPGSGAKVVELRLTWLETEQYSSYKARLRRVGDEQWSTISNLLPRQDGHYFIPVRISAHSLKGGTYQLELRGVAPNGSETPTIEYIFTVTQ